MIKLEIELKSAGTKDDVYELRNYLQQHIEGLDIHIKEQPAREGQMSGGGDPMEAILSGLMHLAVTIPLEELYHHYIQPKIKEWLSSKKTNNDEKLGVVISAKDEKSNIVAEENVSGKSHFYKNLRYNINVEKTRVVLIGNSEFGSSFSAIPPVKGNIEDFSELLTNKLHIGIPRENITIAFNKSSTEIEQVLLMSSKLADTETLIIYYTGHGYRSDINKLYLIASNTVKIDDDIVGGVDIDFIKNRIFKSSQARQKILILDACHSGIATQSDQMPIVPIDVEGSYVLASSPGDDVSYFDKTRANTYFTGALIYLLKNGINNFNEMLSLNDLYEYAKDYFIKKNSPQKPAYKSHLNIPAQNFFIARNPAFSIDRWLSKATQLFEAGKLKEALQEARQILKRFPGNGQALQLQQQCSEELEFMEHVREGDEFFYQSHSYSAAKKSYEDAYELRRDTSVLGKIRRCESMIQDRVETIQPVTEQKEFKQSGEYEAYKNLIAKNSHYEALQHLIQSKSKFAGDTFLLTEINKLQGEVNAWSNPVNDPRLQQYFQLYNAGNYNQALTELEKQQASDPQYPVYKTLHQQLKDKIKGQAKPPVKTNALKWVVGVAALVAIGWFIMSRVNDGFVSYQDLYAKLQLNDNNALGVLQKKAETEDSANLYLGHYYKQKEEYVTAKEYYGKAFKLPASFSSIGEMLYNGNLPDSPGHKEAVKYFKDANAKATDTTACYYLGEIALADYKSPDWYFRTGDRNVSLKEAEAWFKQGAGKESANCIASLASLLYYNKKDYYSALPWVKKAAERGLAEYQNILGAMHINKQGTTENKNEAARMFQLAADQGNLKAMCNLSSLYIRGDGVEKDCAKAFALVKKVHEMDQRIEGAYDNLGYLYEYGCAGVIFANPDSARHYYYNGAKLGSSFSKTQCDKLKIAY